jgi:uncharacterized protein
MAVALLALALGLFAGTLTTLAGLGGGLMLLLGLSHLVGPMPALALSAVPLLAGNIHRSYLFRDELDWRRALAFCLGAAPAATLVGWWLTGVPSIVLRVAMLALTAMALLDALGLWRWRPPTLALTPAGVAIGGLTATAGGGGILTAPLLMASGLRGEAFIATGSAIAATMHLSRFIGYGAGGAVDPTMFGLAGALALAVVGGNLIGKRLRRRVPPGAGDRLQRAVLLVCVTLALLGMK